MNIENILKIAKEKEKKKIPFNFQIPRKTRDEFKEYCKEHNVTMTDMILTFVELAIQENKKANK